MELVAVLYIYTNLKAGLTDINDGTIGPNLSSYIGTWKHLACSYNQATNTMNIYVDGVIAGTGVLTATPINSGIPASGTHTLFMGAYKNTEAWFQGQMDDVRLYDSVLTATQIGQIMNDSSF